MAVSEIKELFGSVTALTISLGSLASSTAGVGRQATEVDNTANEYSAVIVAVSIKQGTSPTANRAVYVYGIRNNNDTTPIRDDGAGSTDAAWTRKSAGLLVTPEGRPAILYNGSAPATGDVLSGVFVFERPGKKWTIGVVHDTGVALDATGSNHVVSYYGVNPEAQ